MLTQHHELPSLPSVLLVSQARQFYSHLGKLATAQHFKKKKSHSTRAHEGKTWFCFVFLSCSNKNDFNTVISEWNLKCKLLMNLHMNICYKSTNESTIIVQLRENEKWKKRGLNLISVLVNSAVAAISCRTIIIQCLMLSYKWPHTHTQNVAQWHHCTLNHCWIKTRTFAQTATFE